MARRALRRPLAAAVCGDPRWLPVTLPYARYTPALGSGYPDPIHIPCPYTHIRVSSDYIRYARTSTHPPRIINISDLSLSLSLSSLSAVATGGVAVLSLPCSRPQSQPSRMSRVPLTFWSRYARPSSSRDSHAAARRERRRLPAVSQLGSSLALSSRDLSLSSHSLSLSPQFLTPRIPWVLSFTALRWGRGGRVRRAWVVMISWLADAWEVPTMTAMKRAARCDAFARLAFFAEGDHL